MIAIISRYAMKYRKYFLRSDLHIYSVLSIRALRVAELIYDTWCSTAVFALPLV
jgi:hypothetical protein